MLNANEIDELILKVEDEIGNEGVVFTAVEILTIVDALALYKEMNK
jgi:hypothetical protein